MNSATASQQEAHLSEVYPTLPFKPISGRGLYLETAEGRRILDLYAGHAVATLGYGHPNLSSAISRQAEKLFFQSNAVRLDLRDEAANALAAFAPEPLSRVFFVNSGAEANENALRIALKSTGRKKIIAIEHGFHGRTAGAAAVTWGAKQSWYGFPQEPFEVAFVPRNDIKALSAQVDQNAAALIMEPVQGIGGAFDFEPEFIDAARVACDRVGALLILDEVQTGVGRLGTSFGADLYGVRADLLTTAKALGGGFPCGAVLMTDALARDLSPGDLGTTFGGGPLACAVIKTIIETILSENLLQNVQNISAQIRQTCVRGPVTGIQGAGFLLGLRTTPKAAAVRDALLDRDILAGTSADPYVLRLLPPLIMEAEHVICLAEALENMDHETFQ